ncbi:MAG: hypothetical protein Q4G35_14230, partial [Propionibacteriaceae bacterium]|nr:hypothetical protein [Propionibacteriaceae bacterium]
LLMSDEAEVILFEDGDGFLVFGREAALAEVEASTPVATRTIEPSKLAQLGNIVSGIGQWQEMSGRWMKLTPESAHLKQMAGAIGSKDGHLLGMVRGDKGQIYKHLRFEHAMLTPAAPAALGAMATQMALQAALDEITEYLEVIDAKLDRLLKQRKLESLGMLGGVTFAIEEAESILEQTGVVSAITWSKVQANSLALQSMQAESVAQLNALGDLVTQAGRDPDKIADILADVTEDAPFWLGVLARTIALQDRQYALELERVSEAEPDQLSSHREGIRIARAERLRRIGAALATISTSVREATDSSTLTKVLNPLSVPRVITRANTVNGEVARFADKAGLGDLPAEEVAGTPWGAAVQTLLGDAAGAVSATSLDAAGKVGDFVTSTGSNVLEGAKSLGRHVDELRERALSRRADTPEESIAESDDEPREVPEPRSRGLGALADRILRRGERDGAE